MNRSSLLFLCGLPLLWSCDNSCQQICLRMASYADECGIDVSTQDIDACRDAQADVSTPEDRAICHQSGDAQTIRDTWTCEDLGDFWNQAVTNDTGSL